ncbi:ABC transporter permease [Jannaschia aquimarina]|uniref:PotH_2 protein n=1 Tax=Jannaschia aquimarina TaxID=935700 RepID=A0A0D1EHF3_9RHOB|nr:ABC transporter permease [Jannaschia aquimarina]KIT17109.1 Putrescine transport system permease protein PotH [Jannaschia aquimarina]SNS47023.1 spermidine/putrescine transport system permease protein [Jannaschia aquimarina]
MSLAEPLPEARLRARRWTAMRRYLVLSPPLLWTVVFMFVPYLTLVVYSVWRAEFPLAVPDFQFGNYVTIFTDPQYRNVFLRTLKIASLVSLCALLLAFPYAYFLVFRVRSPGWRLALYMAVVAPLWVSYLLRAYTWKTILGTNGILNSFLISAGLIDEPLTVLLYNQAAMVLTLTYVFIPFMVMPIYAALEKIPPSLHEASADLGEGHLSTFFKVTLPLAMPGVIAGFTMTFCLSFGDFIAPMLVGGPDGQMIAGVIATQFGAALNWPLGSALALTMLVFILVLISASDRLERVGQGRLA